jgi:hypothetical protein
MKVVTNADGLIVMMTERGNPTPPEGGAVHELTPEQETEYRALPPNDGVTFIDGVFAALPAPPAPVFPNTSGNALIERRARAAERRGDDVAAIKLRMGIR